jgi:hypothetical protein
MTLACGRVTWPHQQWRNNWSIFPHVKSRVYRRDFVKFGMYVMITYFNDVLHKSLPSVYMSVCVSPRIFARQRLDGHVFMKIITWKKKIIVGCVIFFNVRVLSKESPFWGGFEYPHRSPAIFGGYKSEPIACGYNRATLFLGRYKYGNLALQVGESRIWESKIWSRVPLDSTPRMTALARASSNCKRQTDPLLREDVT